MFLLDSLMISGIRWALDKAITAAEAELNDDSTLREALLEAEMRREMGEIGDDEFREIEADLLARIREIKARRDGGAGAFAFGAQPMETTADSTFQVEADLSGDFYGPSDHQDASIVVTPLAVEDAPPPHPPARARRAVVTVAAPKGRRAASSRAPKAKRKSARLRRS